MGGRGYHNDVRGYLNSNGRTEEYSKINAISDEKMDYIMDLVKPDTPVAPEFSNSPCKTYVLIDKTGKKIKSITIYDKNHEQEISIHIDHPHNGKNGPHVHSGINSGRVDIPLTHEHQKLINKALNKFENWRKKND